MTSASWILLGVAAVAALVDWVAVTRRPSPVEPVAKPLVLVALIGVALTLDPEHDAQRAWFVVALVFSLAGDVFLLPRPNLFVPGLASFLLGHVAFIVGFLQVADISAWGLLPLAVLVVVATRVLRGVRATEPELTAPVVIYITVIGAMVGVAACSGEPVAIAGALLFVASDSLLALNKFEHERPRGPLAVIVTYHVAQALLVVSLV